MVSGLVANIQRYCLHDGPGIRTTVFLKGCPLRCLWCHNPETRSGQSEVITVESRCLGCGACLEACPADYPSPRFETASGTCRRCGDCVEVCPTGARQRVGTEMTVAEVLAATSRDVLFHDESGGGVTLSGGEPLAQADFAQALLETCRTRGIHSALDTCGQAPTDRFLEVARAADLVLFDLKHADPDQHARLTGVSNRLILQNLESLGRVHSNIWLRIPLVPGLNDGESDLDKLAEIAARTGGVRQVHLLPYHSTGVPKFQRLHQDYTLGEILAPGTEQLEAASAPFRKRGLKVLIGG